MKITYPGTGNYTTMAYDGLGRRVQILEYTSGSLSSTKNFVWSRNQICEERDSTGSITKQFFDLGEVVSGSSYFYEKSTPGNIVGATNGGGTEVVAISYDPFGNAITLAGTFVPDFGFAAMYQHPRSGLSLTKHRAYSPSLGRWLSRDPLGMDSGSNLYTYVSNNPITGTDPFGLMDCDELAQEINRIRNELAKRQDELERDPNNLPPTGPNSIEGHQHQFRCKQSYLRGLLDDYNSQGCGGGGGPGLPADAWDFATKPTPQKLVNPQSSPRTQLGSPTAGPPQIPWWLPLVPWIIPWPGNPVYSGF